MGANIVRDIFASIINIVGGRSVTYEQKLVDARKFSAQEMVDQAEKLGVNAVVGVDIEYEVVRKGMLMDTGAGTAVVI
jgi:uncharacterized protein YbjQ (UPF0145 family)